MMLGAYPLDDEHKMFCESIAQFVEKELRAQVLSWEEEGRTPRWVWQRCGELGFLGATFPVELGGLGLDCSYSLLWTQEIAKCGSLGVALGLSVQSDMATPALAAQGNDYIKEQFLKPALRGEKICSIAVSEPDCGSDVAALRTRARKQGDCYIIDGRKMFITNGCQADFITLLARTSDDKGHRCFSLFVIPMDLPGVGRGQMLKKTCFPSSDTAEIILDQVRVPVSHLVGQEGEGFIYQMQQFQYERLAGVGLSLGTLQRCYTLTKRYIMERKVFGKTLASWQITRHKMAQMLAEISMLESMAWHCARLMQSPADHTKDVSMLKLMAAQIQQRVLEECVQMFGGYGLMLEYEVARYFRDSKLMSIGGGSNEVMKEIIAKLEGFN